MKKPSVLMIGPYPEWEMPVLQAVYELHKLWLVDDKDAYINRHAEDIRAIATRGDLGASADLIGSLPNLEWIACFGVGTDAFLGTVFFLATSLVAGDFLIGVATLALPLAF